MNILNIFNNLNNSPDLDNMPTNLTPPYYTFEEHYGKPIPSFPPREVLFDYLKGRWNKEDIQKYIKFSTVVRDVVYNKA